MPVSAPEPGACGLTFRNGHRSPSRRQSLRLLEHKQFEIRSADLLGDKDRDLLRGAERLPEHPALVQCKVLAIEFHRNTVRRNGKVTQGYTGQGIAHQTLQLAGRRDFYEFGNLLNQIIDPMWAPTPITNCVCRNS